MTYLKIYGKRLGYTLLELLISLVLITTLYYFNIIGDGFFKSLELISIILTIFINSYILGNTSNKKAYIEGTKFGGIIISLLLIFTLLFSKFKIRVLIYYLIIMITSILGSMIGISKKRD
ncbi:MAG: TIGR04086 family membrane protein [Bacilli bacterium]|nr:TIGR04086 family membrane protein [Bacilli bacterium]